MKQRCMQITWTNGATIGGSSGSPLIDTVTHKIVGVLTGGYTSCQDRTQSDYYGRLSAVGSYQPASCTSASLADMLCIHTKKRTQEWCLVDRSLGAVRCNALRCHGRFYLSWLYCSFTDDGLWSTAHALLAGFRDQAILASARLSGMSMWRAAQCWEKGLYQYLSSRVELQSGSDYAKPRTISLLRAENTASGANVTAHGPSAQPLQLIAALAPLNTSLFSAVLAVRAAWQSMCSTGLVHLVLCRLQRDIGICPGIFACLACDASQAYLQLSTASSQCRSWLLPECVALPSKHHLSDNHLLVSHSALSKDSRVHPEEVRVILFLSSNASKTLLNTSLSALATAVQLDGPATGKYHPSPKSRYH